jgi:hypothetical protein
LGSSLAAVLSHGVDGERWGFTDRPIESNYFLFVQSTHLLNYPIMTNSKHCYLSYLFLFLLELQLITFFGLWMANRL